MARGKEFQTKAIYGDRMGRKANDNPLIFATVGDDAGVVAVTGRDNFYWICLLDDNNRLTQCYSLIPLANNDMIFVRRAKDRKLTYYEFAEFIQAGLGGTAPPIQAHDHSSAAEGGQNLHQIQEFEFDDATILTIDGAGAVIRTQAYHIIAANAGVADDLDNATGGVEGDELIIQPDAGDTITVRHNQGGAGDFWLAGGANIVLDNQDHLRLIHDGTSWCDQSGGGAPTGAQYVTLALDATLTAERVLTAGAGVNVVDGGAGGNVTVSADCAKIAQHYRDGVLPYYVDTTHIRVMAGDIEIDGTIWEEDPDSPSLDITAGASYIGGVSQRGANKWLYVYVTDDGGTGWDPLLYDEPPLYPECVASEVFLAQVAGAHGAGAVVINYDNDVGEGSVGGQDMACIWTDATLDTWRGAWRVVSINTVANQLTVEANNVACADNDWITIVHGVPRYRRVAGTWYRCVGAVRLNAAQNIIRFYRDRNGCVLYDDYSLQVVLAAGNALAWTDVDCTAYIPPVVALRGLFFLYAINVIPGNIAILIRTDGSASVQGSFFLSGYARGTVTSDAETSPNGAVEYLTIANTDAYIYIVGYYEEV